MADKNAKQEAKKIEIDPKKKATKTEVKNKPILL